jgi:uncharacterized protein (TIGR03435 family)
MRLICLAYQVQYYQVTGPHGLEEDGYDIDATVPARVTRAQFLLLFQNLLASRFHLALHHASKERTVYVLGLAKGGMKMQQNEAGPPSFDITTKEESVVVTAKVQPISALVGFLSLKMGVSGPVIDETGLTGEYSFRLEYTPAEILTGARYKISLSDALQTQLGLKLENKRRPIDVLQVPSWCFRRARSASPVERGPRRQTLRGAGRLPTLRSWRNRGRTIFLLGRSLCRRAGSSLQ